MVHRKADTNHGAANPPSSEDSFSEPAERPWGNPTPQESSQFLLPGHYWLGKMRALALQPAKACTCMYQEQVTSSALRWAGKGTNKLCSHTVPHQPQFLLRRGLGEKLAPSISLQLSSSGMGLKHTGIAHGRGFTLPCCSNGVSCSQYVPKVSLQLPKGVEEAGETPRHWEQPGNAHPSPQQQPGAAGSPSSCVTGTGGKTPAVIHGRFGVAMPISQDPAKGQTQHFKYQPPAFPGYRQSQGELPLCKQKGLCSGTGSAVGYLIAADLVCVIRLQKDFSAAPSPRAPCCQQCPGRDPTLGKCRALSRPVRGNGHKGGF